MTSNPQRHDKNDRARSPSARDDDNPAPPAGTSPSEVNHDDLHGALERALADAALANQRCHELERRLNAIMSWPPEGPTLWARGISIYDDDDKRVRMILSVGRYGPYIHMLDERQMTRLRLDVDGCGASIMLNNAGERPEVMIVAGDWGEIDAAAVESMA